MNITKILGAAAIILASASSTAQAFDSSRKGFQIGVGLGSSTTTINSNSTSGSSSSYSESKMAVDLLLGYGFSRRIVGYLGGKGGSVVVDGQNGSIAVSGVGASLYWSETSPSLYLTGLIGAGSVSLQDEHADLSDTGPGWLAGIGFEVAEGLHAEVSYASAQLVDPTDLSNKSSLSSAFATIKYVWY